MRPHPFDLLFGVFRNPQFAAVRDALGDRRGIDDFLLAGPALELMRELRPDEGLGQAIDDFAALVHAAFLFWHDGEITRTLDQRDTRALCNANGAVPGLPAVTPSARRGDPFATQYIQVAPRIVWGQLDEREPFEPLDGWFAVPDMPQLRIVACFGVHAERPGASVVTVAGERPSGIHRSDGNPLFAPAMPGGDAAGLHAVVMPAELLLLGWRAMFDEGMA